MHKLLLLMVTTKWLQLDGNATENCLVVYERVVDLSRQPSIIISNANGGEQFCLVRQID